MEAFLIYPIRRWLTRCLGIGELLKGSIPFIFPKESTAEAICC